MAGGAHRARPTRAIDLKKLSSMQRNAFTKAETLILHRSRVSAFVKSLPCLAHFATIS